MWSVTCINIFSYTNNQTRKKTKITENVTESIKEHALIHINIDSKLHFRNCIQKSTHLLLSHNTKLEKTDDSRILKIMKYYIRQMKKGKLCDYSP